MYFHLDLFIIYTTNAISSKGWARVSREGGLQRPLIL